MEPGPTITRSTRRKAPEKLSRRFSTKAVKQKLSLNGPSSSKGRKVARTLRVVAIVSLIIFLISIFYSWRRQILQEKAAYISLRFSRKSSSPKASTENTEAVSKLEESSTSRPVHVSAPETPSKHDKDEDEPKLEDDHSNPISNSHQSGQDSKEEQTEKEPVVNNPPAESQDLNTLEWYTRNDFKFGVRPLCRVSKPLILSNGSIFVPEWMRTYENVLHRCGLGKVYYYTDSGKLSGVEKVNHLDTDFALTIRPDKFQEPTHISSVYLTEHILKSSFMFDVFSGDSHPTEEVKEQFCILKPTGSNCDTKRPGSASLKPGIFVPRRIEHLPPENWSRKIVDMVGEAYGHGRGVVHLNASSVLARSHRGKSDHLIGTSFRSVLSVDGMFRHLPPSSLGKSNYYSERNGLIRTVRKVKSGGKCSLSIGIAKDEDESVGIGKISEIMEKIEALSKLAMPSEVVNVRLIHFGQDVTLEDHIQAVQNVDMYVASGENLNSIGYLRSGATVYELMPFGIAPNTHESLSRALGLNYNSIQGKPQDKTFKQCINTEIDHLRRKGYVSQNEKPSWYGPTMKAWTSAIGEYALSGSSNLDFMTSAKPIQNYFSRICAMKQLVEVAVDEAARKIVHAAQIRCSSEEEDGH